MPDFHKSALIADFLDKESKSIAKIQAREAETGKAYDLTLNEYLLRAIKGTKDYTTNNYADLLKATTGEERHKVIEKIIGIRVAIMTANAEESEQDKEEATLAENAEGLKAQPFRVGYLGERFEELCSTYLKNPTEELQLQFMDVVGRMMAIRRMRFYYDLQQIRMQTSLRNKSALRRYGMADPYIEDTFATLEALEEQQLKVIDQSMRTSPYKEIYSWIVDKHVGCGPLMAGSIISELVDPRRFANITDVWAYAGLKVVDNSPETGRGGHAQRRKAGQQSNWNRQLKTKLLGVLANCFVKSQSKYLKMPGEEHKGRNVKVLQDYKARLNTQNELVPEDQRVYSVAGKEVFQYYSFDEIKVYDRHGNPTARTIAPARIQRRSKAHINNMSTRYMMKMFVKDVVVKWREIEGLPSMLDYNEQYLRGGRPHGQ